MRPACAPGALGVHVVRNEITAREVVDRIRKNLGAPWKESPLDVFCAGEPDTPVTGVATSLAPSMETLRRAVESKRNLLIVISHEPTFWNHPDNTKDFIDDPIYKDKVALVEKNNPVVWRFHDHSHARKPDMIFLRLTKKLGWEQYAGGENPRGFVMPEITLEAPAKDVQTKLKTVSMREERRRRHRGRGAGVGYGRIPAGHHGAEPEKRTHPHCASGLGRVGHGR
jgi:hypothetical protein